MKSLTIHNMDADLAKAIEAIAKSKGISQNKVIKILLRKALNLSEDDQPKRDVSAFFGVWTQQDLDGFNQSTSFFEQIDDEIWK